MAETNTNSKKDPQKNHFFKALTVFKHNLTPAVKFLDLIFRNNFFVFNFCKMCLRWKL